jgi:hypothetical protein
MSTPHTRPLVLGLPMRFMFCFAAWGMALGALAFVHGEGMVRHLLPCFQSEISWLDDTYRIESLTVDREGADQVVRIVVGLARCVFVKGQAYAKRAVTAPMALAFMCALDVPFVLWASLWSLHVDSYAPDLWSPLLVWRDFLQGGGRFALAVLLGLASAAAVSTPVGPVAD